jgi:hypothetical protein
VTRRFQTPVWEFDPAALLHGRRRLALSLGLAALVHLLLAGIEFLPERQQTPPRPMVTRFVKREPRLTKPLELRKIPQPRRQLARRDVQLARARMDQVQATAGFNTRSLIAAHVGGSAIRLPGPGRSVTGTSRAFEPALTAKDLRGTRVAENRIDMALEMLDVNSMDTGRYRAMVVQDAGDKQAIKGFVKFAQVIGSRSLAGDVGGTGDVQLRMSTLDRLRDVVNEFTGLQADFVGLITYDDPRLLDVPILLPQGLPTEVEMANLTRYLLAGGFVFGDVIGDYGEGLEKYGGLVRGKDFWTERLPEDHPIFHSYFDLDGGMPFGFSNNFVSKVGANMWNFVTGHYVRGRLVGVTPGHGGWGWQKDAQGGDSTRQLQLAVNIIIYALTQEGSITQRLMQLVN